MFETIGLNPVLIESGSWDRLCNVKEEKEAKQTCGSRWKNNSVGGGTADPLGSLGVLSPCAAGGGGVTAVTVPKRRKPTTMRKTRIGLA